MPDRSNLLFTSSGSLVSEIAVFVLKRDVKLQPSNHPVLVCDSL